MAVSSILGGSGGSMSICTGVSNNNHRGLFQGDDMGWGPLFFLLLLFLVSSEGAWALVRIWDSVTCHWSKQAGSPREAASRGSGST